MALRLNALVDSHSSPLEILRFLIVVFVAFPSQHLSPEIPISSFETSTRHKS